MIDLDKTIFIKYDIETYVNFFCVVFKFSDRYKVFEISSRKDETEELRDFLREGIEKDWYLVGFNNVRFDAQVLQFLLDDKSELIKYDRGDHKANILYQFAQRVITATSNREFPPYPEYKLANKQIDLFLQNHYNNMARSTSLKWLEYSMNWKKIQDLPYHHATPVDEDKLDTIIDYCKNDVDATDIFFGKTQDLIELRFVQHSENPDLNLLNKSDSSVGEALFLDLMADKLDIKKSILKKKQTHHKKINLKDVILPYVAFQTEEFKGVLEFFRESEITSTNNAFKHVVEYQGIEYVYGTGGIHASPSNIIMKETDDELLLDLDAASFYPNISIRNHFFPRHLSEQFCELYEELYEKRKVIPKSNPQNKSIKLLLNSVYGKSGDLYSFLYDKFFQMCITVNGQLLLTMLAEQMSFIDGVTVFYANTDGITLKVKKDEDVKKKVYQVWKWWEKLTGLELEHAIYKQMILRDVNNYLAEMEDGKIKLKGAFEIDLELHKNRSQRIVAIAVRRYFIDGVSAKDTIENHLGGKDYGKIENQGIFDFCLGKKIKSNQNYTLEKPIERTLPEHKGEEIRKEFLLENNWMEIEENRWQNEKYHKTEKSGDTLSVAYNKCLDNIYPPTDIIQDIDDKVIRFYVSNSGDYLYKNYSDGRKQVTVGGNKVSLFMDYEEKIDYEIDYQYYIDETYKIIHEVDGTNDRIAQENKEKREQEKRDKEEENFVKFCVNKAPTELQLESYGKEWLIEKYGMPEEVRPSKRTKKK